MLHPGKYSGSIQRCHTGKGDPRLQRKMFSRSSGSRSLKREKVVCVEDGVVRAMLIVACVGGCLRCSLLMLWVTEEKITPDSHGGHLSICGKVLCHN